MQDGLLQTAVICVCLAVCASLASAVLRPKLRTRFLASPWLYSIAVVLSVLWARLPWLVAGELNADESMFLASARKLLYDAIFFRSVDGGTSGPLNYYAAVLPRLVGLPFDYSTTHLMNGVYFGAALVFLYLTARTLLPEFYARLSVLPALGAVMEFRHGDLLHYSSECVSVFLIAAGSYLLISAMGNPTPWRFVLLGVAVALLPFAKLQSGPCALILGGFGFVLARRQRIFLLLGVAGTAGAILLLIVGFGQFQEFLTTYIQYNIGYANSTLMPPWTLDRFLKFFNRAQEIAVLLKVTAANLLLIAVTEGIRWARKRERVHADFVWLFGLALFAASLYQVYRPMRDFTHYWLYIVFPAALLLIIGLRTLVAQAAAINAGVFLLLTLAIPLYWNAGLSKGDIAWLVALPPTVECRACDAISKYAKPGDLISVWGWTPQIYVRTGTIHASRESFTERQVSPYPLRPYFEHRYVEDLKRLRPLVFVDAVGPGRFAMWDRSVFAHERYPEVDALITANFDFVDEVDGYRIYVRKK